MDYAAKAESIMQSGLNCAQAVAGAFSDLFADRISEADLLKLASPFGGGFARKGDLCGALSGMGIAFGLMCGTDTPADRLKTYETAALLTDRFEARYGSISCRELKEMVPPLERTPRTPAWTDEEAGDPRRPCIDYVRGAAQILESYLAEEGLLRG